MKKTAAVTDLPAYRVCGPASPVQEPGERMRGESLSRPQPDRVAVRSSRLR
jgi:hypothetical protein